MRSHAYFFLNTSNFYKYINCSCFLFFLDGLGTLDGSTLLFQPGQSVQLEDGTTAYISATGDLDEGVCSSETEEMKFHYHCDYCID